LVSFRDPEGSVFRTEAQIFRCVSVPALDRLEEFLSSATAQDLLASGKLVGTKQAAEPDRERAKSACRAVELGREIEVLEHERVWFASYPAEWPAEMLFAAGELTLEIAEAALGDGYGLKDATPNNVLFDGPKPVFIDVLSFEKRDERDATWLPYAQFVRTFVLPLLINGHFGMPAGEVFLHHRDGLTPEEVYRLCSWAQRFRPAFLGAVSIPTWLGKRVSEGEGNLYRPRLMPDAEQARYILARQFRQLKKLLGRVAPRKAHSAWSSYTQNLSYAEREFQAKSELVAKWIVESGARTVLDLGCNTGHFSEIAARAGARVVATDIDPVVVGETWRRARASKLDILPLVVNAARPTPATGWRNAEQASFLSRATGQFDVVMMLALLHHLLVTERIPLTEVIDLAASLTKSHAIIEYVSKDDPLFRRLTRGREALHEGFTQEAFESRCRQRFQIAAKQPVKGTLRWLYLLRKRDC
jgi:SAM-dependent methyltransferase